MSILNALEAYTYATILTEGVAGTSPYGMIIGQTDLAMENFNDTGVGNPVYRLTGDKEISLGDIVSNPGDALSVMSMNLQSNLVPMAIASLTTGIGFRFGKRLLRRPISNINRNIMKPLLGAGIKL